MKPTIVDLMAIEARFANDRDRSRLQNVVRERYDLSGIRWAQLVNAALVSGAAYEADPMTAAMLARRVQARRRKGSALNEARKAS